MFANNTTGIPSFLIRLGFRLLGFVQQFWTEGDVSINTKLGEGWEEFCVANDFQVGDTIRFKFFEGVMSFMVHVFKINV